MIDIPDKITHSLSKETLGALNHRCGQPLTRDTIRSLNGESSGITGRVCLGSSAPSERAEDRRPAARTCLEGQTVEEIHQGKALPKLTVPTMRHPLRKGQKVSIDPQDRGLTKLEASFGWNMQDARCDMDVSAFLITGNGKVQMTAGLYSMVSQIVRIEAFTLRKTLAADTGKSSASILKNSPQLFRK